MFQKTLTRGRYNESNYPVQELGRKEGGGHIFEGGVLAGHYGIYNALLGIPPTCRLYADYPQKDEEQEHD